MRASASRPSGKWNDDDFDVLVDGQRADRVSAPTRQGGEGGPGLATTHTGGMGRVMTN